MFQRFSLLKLLMALALPATFAFAQIEDDDDLYLIELDGFEVFSNNMKIIDGATGKEYSGDHPVVLGFRREFDNTLTRYHKKLLSDEYKHLKARADTIPLAIKDLDEMTASFGMDGFEVEGPHLTREFAIFRRMVKDPFFKIKELVVWDLRALKLSHSLPKTKYAKSIRFNEEKGEWERRVTTKWHVSYVRNTKNRYTFHTYKEQGLNLDSNKGYHLIDVGLPADIPPHAFKEVALEYPIFFNKAGSTEKQVADLTYDFVENLIYLYDPFSWVARGNTRFRGGFKRQLQEHIKDHRLNLENREWFENTFSHFLNDVMITKYWGAEEIYDAQMLHASPKNRNLLGEDLDLLNWHKNEKRKIDYDPTIPSKVPYLGFNHPGGARYIMFDAYRRYGDKFIDALRTRILNTSTRQDAKQLVKDAIEEASGVSVEKYIPAATKAQKAELSRFLRK